MLYLERANIKDAEKLVDIKVDTFFEEIKKYNCSPPDYDAIEKQIVSIKNYYVYKIIYDKDCVGGITLENMGGMSIIT